MQADSAKKLRPTGKQITAARGLLGWSQAELAEAAGVAEMTIRRFESGPVNQLRKKTLEKIQGALEAQGIEFTNGTGRGVRLRSSPADVNAEDIG